MFYSALLVTVLLTLGSALPAQQNQHLAKVRKGVVSQEVDKEEGSQDKSQELVHVLKDNVLRQRVEDDTGKVIPGQVAPGAVGLPELPGKDRNWARKMNEAQWHQQKHRLNPKPFPEYKRVMHNRNTINDNRHDRKGMKLARHPH